MAQETFVNYRNFRWLWITAISLLVLTAVYLVDSPVGGRNGGTVLGYSYGIIATAGIVWLMAYGLRKRAYHSSLGTVEGWLAAHVWIGIGLLLVVPLHSGFSFACNIHTAAYLFMVVTILTGIWGALNYSRLSGKITAHRGGAKDTSLLGRISDLGTQAEELCKGKSETFLKLYNTFDASFSPSLVSLLTARSEQFAVDQRLAGDLLAAVPDSERQDAISLLGILDQRLDMMRHILEQSRIKALLKIWLYVHVPVSFALCVALAVHIFLVLFYR